MYEEHPVFKAPSESTTIWRYMDFTKFVSLLDRQALFFVKGLTLKDDPFEGAIPDSMFNEIIRQVGGDEGLENFRIGREAIAISSWHVNDVESAAMWKVYLTGSEGIAIRTTFERLCDSFRNTERTVYIGEVEYIDYETQSFESNNASSYFLHKRPNFSHENELRAVTKSTALMTRPQEFRAGSAFLGIASVGNSSGKPVNDLLESEEITANGIYIPVNLATLIECVIVAPTAEEWFVGLVGSVVKKYGLGGSEVKKSELSLLPR